MMLGGIIGLSALGVVTIGGVVLERKFVENDDLQKAKLVSGCLFHGLRVVGICYIGYVALKMVVWFL